MQQAGFVTGLSLILFLGWVTDWVRFLFHYFFHLVITPSYQM